MNVQQAVKELRKEYGEAQQAFSNRLGLSLSSIANYESGMRVPDGSSAIKLALAAQRKNRPDLEAVFAPIIRDSLGCVVAPIHTEDEHRKVRALQYVLFDPRFEHLREPLAELLGPVEKHLRTLEARSREKSRKLFEDLDAITEKGTK